MSQQQVVQKKHDTESEFNGSESHSIETEQKQDVMNPSKPLQSNVVPDKNTRQSENIVQGEPDDDNNQHLQSSMSQSPSKPMLAPLNQRENDPDDKIDSERDHDANDQDLNRKKQLDQDDPVQGEIINTKDQNEKLNHSITDDQTALLKDKLDDDLESDDQNSPLTKLRQFYDLIKFLGVIVYNFSLMTMIGYFSSSRFISKYVMQLFAMFLIARPIVVTLYAWTVACTTIQDYRFQNKWAKKRQTQIAVAENINSQSKVETKQENNDEATANDQNREDQQDRLNTIAQEIEDEQYYLPTKYELLANFIYLPLIAYAGLGRVVMISDDKKQFVLVCRVLEVCLHTVPLFVILIFNNQALGKYESMDTAAIVFAILNVLEVYSEQFIMKSYENKGVDLEERERLVSTQRQQDLSRAATLSAFWTLIMIVVGLFAFSVQDCRDGFFVYDNECRPCNVYVDELCQICTSPIDCIKCQDGYYADDGQCFDCIDTYGVEALLCDKNEVLECTEEYFVSDGACVECDTLAGCQIGKCGLDGCTLCDAGFYLDDGVCYNCTEAIPGCSDCIDIDECISCNNDFLTISSGMCTCKGVGEHQVVNATTGACGCETDYFMTEEGCKTCSGVIDRCFDCDLNTDGLGFRLYESAALTPDIEYLDCEKCNYGYYKESNAEEESVQCLSCFDKWEGCAYCGEDGAACERCYQTYVFSNVDPDVPCTRCDYYLANCEKCTSQSNCKVCDIGYKKLAGACVNAPW